MPKRQYSRGTTLVDRWGFRDILALVSGRQSELLGSREFDLRIRELEHVTVLMVHAQLQCHCQLDFRAK